MAGRRAAPGRQKSGKGRDDRGEYRGIYRVMIHSPEYQQLSNDARRVLIVLKLELGKAGIDVLYLPDHWTEPWGSPSEGVSKGLPDVLHELALSGWIRVQGNVCWLRNGLRFDPTDPLASPNGRKGIVAHLMTLPKLPIINDFLDHYPVLKREVSKMFEVSPFEGVAEGPSEGLEGASDTDDGRRMTDIEGSSGTLESRLKETPAAAGRSPRTHDAREHPQGSAGNDNGQQQQQQIIEQLTDLVSDAISRLSPRLADRFTAGVHSIITGHDVAAWLDPRSDDHPVPWEKRPQLLELALDVVAGEDLWEPGNLRRALRLVVRQQLTPFAFMPAPGSEAAEVAASGEDPPRRYESSEPERIQSGELTWRGKKVEEGPAPD